MNLNFKEKLKHMDRFHRQQILVYFMLFGFMIGETVVLVQLTMLSNQYSKSLISMEEFLAKQNNILTLAGVYMGVLIVCLMMFYFWMKLLQVEYEKEQQMYDSQKIRIKIGNDEYEYLLQSDPDNSRRVKTKNDLLLIIENSKLFQSLFQAFKSGVKMFSFDEANFLKEQFNEFSKETAPKLNQKGKKIEKEVK
ncbi:MAG: hypothetical protein ACTSWL_08230 [Promethearchaeota archaeon]